MSKIRIAFARVQALFNLTLATLLLSSLTSCSTTAHSIDSRPSQSDNRVTFYPSYGYQQKNQWHIPFRVWVSATPNKVREITAKGSRKFLRKTAGIDELTQEQKDLYRSRVRDFIANSKSDRHVVLQFDNDPALEKFAIRNEKGERETDFNGLLLGSMTLSEDRAEELLKAQGSEDNWLSFSVTSGKYAGNGRIQLISPQGITVVSDIDDTAKITGITESKSIVINNVFFSEFEASPCMAQMYQSFGEQAVFHYVSGGPWQLYEPTANFLFSESIGFPSGSVHMKNVRTNFLEKNSYKDFWKLAGFSGSATVAQKTDHIERLMRHFPERRFVLIGDSGEHDPEIFQAIRQRNPDQITEIKIRDVVNAAVEEPMRLDGMTVISPDGKTCG